MGMVGFDELTDTDTAQLRALIEEHTSRTGSTVAQRVLDEWATLLPKFVKIMPHDYKRALAELAAEGDAFSGEGPVTEDHPVSTSGEGFVITETEETEVGA